MSLINDLLRDLDDRRGGNKERHELVEGLSHVHEPASRNNAVARYVLIVTVVILLLLAFILYMPIEAVQYKEPGQQEQYTAHKVTAGKQKAVESAGTNATRQPPGTPGLKLDEALNPSMVDHLVPGNQPPDTAPVETDVLVKDIRFSAGVAGMQAVLALSRSSEYRLYRLRSPERLVVEIPQGRISELKLENIENDLVRSVRHGLHDGYLKLVFDLNKPVRIVNETIQPEDNMHALSFLLKTDPDEQEQPASEIAGNDGIRKLAAEAVHNRQMEKTPRHNTTGTLAEMKFNEGVRQYEQGDLEGSIESLIEAIELDPNNGDARYLLASAYIQQERSDAAIALLAQSVRLLPGNAKIKKLYAQILFHLGRRQQAVDVLRMSSPLINEEPEYHALLAAVLQDMEKHAQAADIYRSLVNIYPDRSIWWMGLGISLEAQDRQSAALAAYEKALQGNSLTNSLRQYVSKRIRLLTDEIRT